MSTTILLRITKVGAGEILMEVYVWQLTKDFHSSPSPTARHPLIQQVRVSVLKHDFNESQYGRNIWRYLTLRIPSAPHHRSTCTHNQET